MSFQKHKSSQSSNLSSSPVPHLKSENRTSVKLSLLKLNETFVKPPDSSSKLSKSLNTHLPQIYEKDKNPKFSQKAQKSFRKNVLDSQSPSFSIYYTPTRETNVMSSFKDAKYIFDEENKKHVDEARKAEISKKRDFLRGKRERIYKFEPNLKPKIYQGILHLVLLMKTYNEDFITKYFENTDEAKVQALDRITDIEACFYKVYEDLLKELSELQETLSESEKKVILLTQKNDKIKTEFEEKLKKNSLKKETPKEKEIGFIVFENTKLEMEIQKLKEKLKIFENYDAGPIMKELELVKLQSEEKIKSLQYDLNILKGKDDGHQNLINFYKNNISKLEKDVKHWISTSGENQKIIDRMTLKQETLTSSMNRFREISMMQMEDISILMAKKQDSLILQHDLHEKIKNLSSKIDKLTIQKGDNVNENDYKSDMAIISTLSDFFSENLFQKIMKNNPISNQILSKTGNRGPTIAPVRSFESNNSNPTVLRKFSFLKAPFFKLIEHRFKTMNYSLKPNKKPNFHELLSKIRGIFDCKYNEFLCFSEPKLLTSFPDFVYSWLGKYEVDYTLHLVRKMDPFAYNNNLDDIRIQFLLELTNPKIEKLWECSVFCEFLEEKYSLDELYFYLHCRNLILKGPQLQYLTAFFDLIHFVSFERAETTIDLIMHKYDISIRSTIKGKLSEKAKRKGPNAYIDSAFVLRVLLEYYRLERVDKFNMLDELFNSKMHKDEDKETVSFENFKKIIQFNWPQITDLETCELYRESWGVGQGAVNAEVFFAVANESKFFVKTLKVPSIMNFEEDSLSKNPYEKIRSSFFEIYSFIKDKLDIIEEILSSLGLEMLDEKFKKMLKIIQSDFQMPSEEMKEKFISHFSLDFGYLIQIMLKTARGGTIFQDPSKELQLIGNKDNFKEIGLQIKEISKEQSLKEIRENAIARKIQKKMKSKIRKPPSLGQVVKNLKK